MISKGLMAMQSSAYLLPQCSKPLLLGMGVDVSSNDERNDVEEWYPGLFREELLSKCQAKRRRDPANLHDWHETSSDCCSNLVPRSRASNDGH